MLCSCPQHEVTSMEKIQKIWTDMVPIEERKQIKTLLPGNNCQPCNNFQTSVTDLKNSNIISLMSEKTDMPHEQEAVKSIFNTFHNKFIDNTCLIKEQENLVV